MNKLKTCALRWSLYNFIPKCTVLITLKTEDIEKGTDVAELLRHYPGGTKKIQEKNPKSYNSCSVD
jgi:hypothetical protein